MSIRDLISEGLVSFGVGGVKGTLGVIKTGENVGKAIAKRVTGDKEGSNAALSAAGDSAKDAAVNTAIMLKGPR